MNNHQILEELFARGAIDLRRGAIFDVLPAARQCVDWDRIEGLILGLAIGDSLGNHSESMTPRERRARHGEIRDYLATAHANGERVGVPSDDTQLAAWTLEQLVADGQYVPAHVAEMFRSGRIHGIGQTVREFLGRMAGGVPWYEAGPQSAGNGALMRVAPILIPHLRRATPALWIDSALVAMTTHNDNASIASCIAFTAIFWDLIAIDSAPAPEWWLDRFSEVSRDLATNRMYRTRDRYFPEYEGPFLNFVRAAVTRARASGLSALDACNRTGSGAYLMETVPSVLSILERHARDPEEAIIRAVNDTWDNDSIAAIVGAAVGALHGARALPARWKAGLLGRTRDHDDGRLFAILDEARQAFGGANVGPTAE